jgi:hypothetical protein
VQRCYYQPVTCYQTKTYYEQITTYRTSYYYEPVTSYRYSCYYDPCTCSYKQVACPTTCYQLRSQCCPVQSWVQRCCTVPVTTYQQSFYWEPITTCCQPASCPAPAVAQAYPPATNGAAAAPAVTDPGRIPPGVTDLPPRSLAEPPANPQDRIPPNPGGTSYRQQLPFRGTTPVRQQPAVKWDRVTSTQGAQIEGQLVRSDRAPAAGVQVLFVSSDRQTQRKTVDTNSAGQFQVMLASGAWLVYVQDASGKAVFQRKLEVGDNETRHVRLVSR